jgi:hypothetical protein
LPCRRSWVRIPSSASHKPRSGGVSCCLFLQRFGVEVFSSAHCCRELRKFQVENFNGAGAARDSRDYPNARSQAWFDFAEQLAAVDLDDDEQLAADLVAPTYRIDSRGRRVVEAKADTRKRLGRSPDRADAVLMAFAAGNRRPMRSFVPRGRIDDSWPTRRRCLIDLSRQEGRISPVSPVR